MTITDTTQGAPAPGRGRTRRLTVAVAILSVLAIGLGAWLVYELQATSPAGVGSDVEVLLEDYLDAWNTYDGEGFLELVSSDYRFYDDGNDPGMTAEETAEMISTNFEAFEFTVEAVGPYQGIGDEVSMDVVVLERYSNHLQQEPEPGASAFQLVNTGDGWLVEAHHVILMD